MRKQKAKSRSIAIGHGISAAHGLDRNIGPILCRIGEFTMVGWSVLRQEAIVMLHSSLGKLHDETVD
jgi:hypothetical protein